MYFVRSKPESKKAPTPPFAPAPAPAASTPTRRAPAGSEEAESGEVESEDGATGTGDGGDATSASDGAAGGTNAAGGTSGNAAGESEGGESEAENLPENAELGDISLRPSSPAFCGQKLQARASTRNVPADTTVRGELSSGATSVATFSGTTDGHVASGTFEVTNVSALLSDGAREKVANAKLSIGRLNTEPEEVTIRRVADFGFEDFESQPEHRVANGYASLKPLFRGSVASNELKLKLRIKYVVGWRGWMLFINGDWTPGWRMGATNQLHFHDGSSWQRAPALPAASVREVAYVAKSGGGREAWGKRFPEPALMPDYDVSSSEVRKTLDEIARAWDGRFEVKRSGCTTTNCCRWVVRLETTLSRSESSPDAEITLIGATGGPGRSNVYEWYFSEEVPTNGGRDVRVAPVRDDVHAHEAGHMLGAYDEYEGGATGLGSARVIEDDSIMGAQLSTPHKRHIEDAATFLAQKARSKHRLDWRLEVKDRGEA